MYQSGQARRRVGRIERKKASSQQFSLESLEGRQLLSSTTTVLLDDRFDGKAVNGQNWHIPLWTPDGSTFLGRTQLACSQNASPPRESGGAVHLTLDTFNPTGFSFYGTELISNKTFKVGSGLDVKVTARFNSPIPKGIVGGLFLYAMKTNGNHDEIDSELLSNNTSHFQTNIYANEPLGAGSPVFSVLPHGGKLTGYHVYEMKCSPKQVLWYVDGVLVRTEKQKLPAGPVQVYLNIWAPAQDWQQAYNAGIQPTAAKSANKRFGMDVDRVVVKSMRG